MIEVRDLLKSLDVKAKLFESFAQVDLIQTFQNTTKEAIEFSYLFPVPSKAQVTGFTAKIGDKIIHSEIEESEKAFEEYDKAIQQGDSAGIVESLRKDILELSFGNLLPSETAVVMLSYLQELNYTDKSSEITWRIPFVVAPRYDNNPTSESIRIQPVIAKNSTTIQLEACIQQSNSIKSISSPSHPIQVSSEKNQTIVRLAKSNEKADSDFVLHITLDAKPMNYLFTEKAAGKGLFSLIQITPEIAQETFTEKPRQVGFLLDISGSMDGEKIHQAKQALKLCLRQLSLQDSFNIIAFTDNYFCFKKTCIPYNEDSLKKADKWIEEVHGGRGTEILAPLSELLTQLDPAKPGIILLFTDGQVSDEDKIIRLVEQHAHHIQLFPFGIDTAVNESFIDGIAAAGNGLPEYIVPGERIEDKVLRQLDRMSSPYWEDSVCYDENQNPLELFPPFPKKMFAGETYTGLVHDESIEAISKITLNATFDSEKVQMSLKPEKSYLHGVLPSWWALEKIRSLEKHLNLINPRRRNTHEKLIIQLSKDYSVLSTLTSLVAVMQRETKAKGTPTWIRVPVCPPKGWEMPITCGSMEFQQDSLSHRKLNVCSENYPVSNKPIKNASFTPMMDTNVSVESPMETEIRKVALLQHADGSIGNKQNLLQNTSLFIMGILLSGSDWQGYKKALKKAAQFLISESAIESFYQACALVLIQKHTLFNDKSLESHLKQCIQKLTADEKQFFEQFQMDSLTTFAKYLVPNEFSQLSREEMVLTLLKNIIP